MHAFPASGVVCRLRGSACHVAVWERSQFRLCLPLGAGLASRPAALVPRLYQAYTWLLRGLGGLFRLKLRYKGKSFKWHRKRGALVLRFGHAHLVALRPFPGIRWRRQGRMRALLYGASRTELVTFAQMVCWWRPMNVYHGRGLRLRRQVVLRKAGKVSAYR